MSAADHPVSEPAPWRGLRDRQERGEFPFQSCTGCAKAVFSPRVLCPHCGSTELEWRSATGAGSVYSQTVLPSHGGEDRQIVLVDMAEGFRVMGVADGARLAIDDAVVGRIEIDPDAAGAEPAYVFTRQEG